MNVRNKVQLITYPDSLGGNLTELNRLLAGSLQGLFPGGIHLLPPFPSSGDRGFAPVTYFEINPDFGTWQDIRVIAKDYDIMLDLMVNHISRQSSYFIDYLKNGDSSPYSEIFLDLEKWPGGLRSQEDLDRLFLRREKPFSEYTIEATGNKKLLWTTFGKEDPSEQIDLNVGAPGTRKIFKEVLECFAENGIKYVRLDAAAYTIKKPGTPCFFIEPEIFEFLGFLQKTAEPLGMLLLPEVHAGSREQNRLSQEGYWIYDFILPFTVLHTLMAGSNIKIRQYLKQRPNRQFTMLDCHDGIPVRPDLEGFFDSSEAKEVVDTCVERGCNLSSVLSPNHTGDNGFNVHQIRGTLYSILDRNDNAYLAARAIQFFTPGIPQVYYAGLMAAENDIPRAAATGDGREINRKNFSPEEVETGIKRYPVRRQIALIRFRNEHPAFNGEFSLPECPEKELRMLWVKGTQFCELRASLVDYSCRIIYSDTDGRKLVMPV